MILSAGKSLCKKHPTSRPLFLNALCTVLSFLWRFLQCAAAYKDVN
jgi:hypothetical protein